MGFGRASTIFLAALVEKNDKRGKQLFEILQESANGTHEIGIMCGMIPQILLMTSRKPCWDYVKKLLLAAQRQEGLRQTVLHGLYNADPGAVSHMFQVLAENKLVRFSSVVKFLNNYLGYHWDSASVGVVSRVVNQFALFLSDAKVLSLIHI